LGSWVPAGHDTLVTLVDISQILQVKSGSGRVLRPGYRRYQ
jgi:hypothetical protein